MIVQTAPEGKSNFVIFQTDHALMCGQIATAFGNQSFSVPDPLAPMVYVAAHHDEGWAKIDARVEMDDTTGLPYNLTKTPLPYLLQTSAGSPAFNEKHHAYSGMMSSMHTTGLFHGRYGLSDKIFIDLIPDDMRVPTKEMITAELERQDKLKKILESDPKTAVLIPDDVLFHNYKLLQFFDTLALYFHMTHEEGRGDSYFENVPQAVGKDVTITIKRVEPGIYTLSPYPFKEETLTLNYWGRPMTPQPVGTNLKALMAATDPISETITLVGT